jgi:imidazolonepropionase-like amidohydrolase
VIDHLEVTLATILERGFTTIMSPGDRSPDILTLKKRLADGVVDGPRLLAVGPVGRAPDHPRAERRSFCNSNFSIENEQAVRVEVAALAEAGADGIKILYDSVSPPMPDDSLVAALAREAKAHDIPLMAHVQTVEDALRAVELGVDRLVHVPTIGRLTPQALTAFATARAPMSSTLHLIAPIQRPGGIRVNHGEREYTPEGLERAEAGLAEAFAIIRALWDAGVPIAFGTDPYRGQPASQDPWAHEIDTLAMVLSPSEVIAALTINGATYLGLDNELGSLEPGKVADILIINGDPLTDPADLSKVQLVIRWGQVVVDNR